MLNDNIYEGLAKYELYSIGFRKHNGKTLPEINYFDLDYFMWGIDNDVFYNRGILKDEAKYLLRRIKNIKIPNENYEDYVVDYVMDRKGDFLQFRIEERSTPQHVGSSIVVWVDEIDLTTVRDCKKYDKSGSRAMIRYLKYYLFNDVKYKMTKKRCEEFFNNDDYFNIHS